MLLPAPSGADINHTPGDFTAIWFEPYIAHLGVLYHRVRAELIDEGYVVDVRTYDWDVPSGPGNEQVTIEQLRDDFQDGYAVWLIGTHGSTNSFSVRTYSPSQLAQRDADLQAMMNSGLWQAGDLVASTAPPVEEPGGYAISVTRQFIERYHRSPGTPADGGSLIINGSCQGHAYTSSWRGARAVLSYNYCALNTTVHADAETVFTRLGGNSGRNKRDLAVAVQGTDYSFSPTTNFKTELSPMVVHCDLPSGALISGQRQVKATFSSAMDSWESSQATWSTGGVAVTSPTWANDTTMKFWVGPWTPGAGEVRLLSFDVHRGQYDGLRGKHGIPLNGDGQGDGLDDYSIPTFTTVNNPGASLSAFTATRQAAGTLLNWQVESQSGTDHYLLMGSESLYEPFELVGSMPADSLVFDYDLATSSRYQLYRLLEVETDGDTLTLDDTEAHEAITLIPDPTNVEALADALRATTPALSLMAATSPNTILPIYGIIYVVPNDDWIPALQPLLDDRVQRGHVVTVVTWASFGSLTSLRDYFSIAYQYGLWGVTLVGDAEDTEWWNQIGLWIHGWTRPNWPSEAQFNLIPMTYWLDPIGNQAQSRSWFRPFSSGDWPLGDFDGDGRPEIAISRIPARIPAEVTIAVAKIRAFEAQDFSNGSFLLADQGRSYNGSSGLWASQLADSFAQLIPPTLNLVRLHDTDAAPLTHTQAKVQFLDLCASVPVVAATFTGTVFNRNQWHWLNRTDGDYWSHLGPGEFLSAVAAPTCELAGLCRRVNPAYGRGMGEGALTMVPDRGPAWIWASNNGSSQGPNLSLGQAFFRALDQGCRSGAHAAMYAVRDVGQLWFQEDLGRGTVVLGDVVTPFPGMTVRTTAVQTPSTPPLSLSLDGNPLRQQGVIRFTLPRSGRVTLDILDPSGRRVERILDEERTAGQQGVVWSGDRLHPGLYFLRLSQGGEFRVIKMTYLR